ncbi:MAG: hypothetical protein KDA32_04800 [Phycisphaerales bacterium]|nr:hypothetical protein [Phycisphaerales bacterium]
MPQLPISDEYFNRSAAVVVDSDYHHKRVRYCVFCRDSGVLCGVNRALTWIRQQCLGPLTVYAKDDGDRFEPYEAVMVIEGMYGELVNLETTYLGMLAFSRAATEMARITEAAGDIPVVDMAARHYPYEIIEQTAYAAAIGGAKGTSTLAGHRYVMRWLGSGNPDEIRVGSSVHEYKLYGSIPHCLNAVYEGSSIRAAEAYVQRFPQIPLTVLIDFEGRELDVCREAAARFGDKLFAVRLDTHGGRIHQGGHAEPTKEFTERVLADAPDPAAARAALDRYGFGPGVTIESVFNTREALDKAGAAHTRILVTSGFDAQKVTAFRNCRAPFDGVGTGSWVGFLVFTSDITHVLENGEWRDRCKAGRGEQIKVPHFSTPIIRQ